MFEFLFRGSSIAASVCLWATIVSLCTAPGYAAALPFPSALENIRLAVRDRIAKRPCGTFVCRVHDTPDVVSPPPLGHEVVSTTPEATPAADSDPAPAETIAPEVLSKPVQKTSGAFGRKENISPVLAWALAGTSTFLYIML